ncbi:hypothetical protein CAP39_07655 [Sphingomonas sp. IBVSS1]|nr:hypothetical protein CAP39_07655 [Sphingomonas sp. IBVSS1]
MKRYLALLLSGWIIVVTSPSFGQNVEPPPGYQQIMAMQVPVIAGDISDRPYRVLGLIETGVRKSSIFHKDPDQRKVYAELWERGKKMGADAVIKAEYGEARVRGASWGSREARGLAIKFLSDRELSALPSVGKAQP